MAKKLEGRTWQAGPNASLLEIAWEVPPFIATVLLSLAFMLEKLAGRKKKSGSQQKKRGRSIVIALLCYLLAGVIALWVTWVFALEGKGTPAPSQPPRELVIAGPFKYTRHPMYLSFILAFYGTGRLLGLKSTLPLLAIFVAYLRHHAKGEEEVLLERFGEAYQTYRQKVPGGLPFMK
ncbi:MAG TPA: isoprenylcysteine carboxylmethyltransferase family protein [Chloroflexia bacterium]|nr:isoprenylcysteine carboxylmethyltransferase family protein [Chloroflexia bacterium]